MKPFDKNNKTVVGLMLLLFLVLLSSNSVAQAFTIDDIKVSGLQRVQSSIVFSAIDVKAGMTVDEADLQRLIRDLFATEFFSDVQVGVDNNILVINVIERPVINIILIEGNKVIPTDSLVQALESIELGENEVFKQSALESISRELNAQYSALGRYAAQIETFVKDIGQNQVQLGIRIQEGQVSKIKYINIIGNEDFDESELRDLLSLKTTGTWSWLTGNDKYARELLAGDLERLRSFYLDRGYLQFDIVSSQVSLSPDKETVYITITIEEGDQFTVDEIALSGDPVLSEEEVESLITLSKGENFSQFKVTETEQAISKRLSDEGYSSVRVSGSPELDEKNKTAKVTFSIDPGAITYVRRIRFEGNKATSDNVLRREMRQLEGAPVSTEKIRLSRLRLERLGIFSSVNLETINVPGSNDQVDIVFTVAEQSTASVNANVGFSSSTGVSFGAGLQHNNWLGSGNTFGFNVEQSESQQRYSLNFENPYFTKEGVSRGISLFLRRRDFSELNVSQFSTNSYGARVNFGYPISETGRVSLGLNFENTEVEAGITAPQEIQGSPNLRDAVNENFTISETLYNDILDELGGLDEADTNNNGQLDENDDLPSNIESNTTLDVTDIGDNQGAVTAADLQTPQGFIDENGNEFNNLSLNFGWSNSTFNRGIFPTSGFSQRFNAEVSIPIGDLEFYRLSYNADAYFPLGDTSAFRLRGRLGFADSYGDTTSLPFFENFFSGGIGSVRGFEASSLGPKGTPASSLVAAPVDIDNTGTIDFVYVAADDGGLLTYEDDDVDAIGGDTLVELSAELIFPTPFIKNKDKVRTTFFIDAGNVFSTNCGTLQINCSTVDFSRLSVSGGVSLQWLSPIAPLSFSFARPLVEQPFDSAEFFQFSLGRTF